MASQITDSSTLCLMWHCLGKYHKTSEYKVHSAVEIPTMFKCTFFAEWSEFYRRVIVQYTSIENKVVREMMLTSLPWIRGNVN